MSDTPRTDAAIIERRHIHKRGGSVQLLELVDADLPRKLERECNSLQDQRDLSIRMAKERERERDEARRGIRLMAQNAEVWKERADQARRELDIQLESIHFHMERVPVREHPLRVDDAKLCGEEGGDE